MADVPQPTVPTVTPNAVDPQRQSDISGGAITKPSPGLDAAGNALGQLGDFAQQAAVRIANRNSAVGRARDQQTFEDFAQNSLQAAQTDGDMSNPNTVRQYNLALKQKQAEIIAQHGSDYGPDSQSQLAAQLEDTRGQYLGQASSASAEAGQKAVAESLTSSLGSLVGQVYNDPKQFNSALDKWYKTVDNYASALPQAQQEEYRSNGRAAFKSSLLDYALSQPNGDVEATKLVNQPNFWEDFTPDQIAAARQNILQVSQANAAAKKPYAVGNYLVSSDGQVLFHAPDKPQVTYTDVKDDKGNIIGQRGSNNELKMFDQKSPQVTWSDINDPKSGDLVGQRASTGEVHMLPKAAEPAQTAAYNEAVKMGYTGSILDFLGDSAAVKAAGTARGTPQKTTGQIQAEAAAKAAGTAQGTPQKTTGQIQAEAAAKAAGTAQGTPQKTYSDLRNSQGQLIGQRDSDGQVKVFAQPATPVQEQLYDKVTSESGKPYPGGFMGFLQDYKQGKINYIADTNMRTMNDFSTQYAMGTANQQQKNVMTSALTDYVNDSKNWVTNQETGDVSPPIIPDHIKKAYQLNGINVDQIVGMAAANQGVEAPGAANQVPAANGNAPAAVQPQGAPQPGAQPAAPQGNNVAQPSAQPAAQPAAQPGAPAPQGNNVAQPADQPAVPENNGTVGPTNNNAAAQGSRDTQVPQQTLGERVLAGNFTGPNASIKQELGQRDVTGQLFSGVGNEVEATRNDMSLAIDSLINAIVAARSEGTAGTRGAEATRSELRKELDMEPGFFTSAQSQIGKMVGVEENLQRRLSVVKDTILNSQTTTKDRQAAREERNKITEWLMHWLPPIVHNADEGKIARQKNPGGTAMVQDKGGQWKLVKIPAADGGSK